ncbi:MAG: TrkH family potassium uptake protein [Proteobacteria bacterium]|nr:TrkH family potassium uptake protein [Pseudomonadota bacterium]
MLAVAHVLGLLLAAFAATCVLPIGCSLWYGDHAWSAFLVSAAIALAVGLALAGVTYRFRRELKPRDGFLLVTLAWLVLPAAAALPLLLALPDLSFTGAFFEAMSGLTTTGSTVLNGLDTLAPTLNFWRALLHWIGGLGIIVMALAILPLLGIGGMQLYKGQAPGVKNERLAPRITETARHLWLVYALLTAAGIVGLKLCGMGWFDAVCHAFSAVSLGGFSTHDRSIAFFGSPAIEFVLMVLMVVGALNFARHFVALRELSLETYKKDPEARAILLLLAGSVLGIAALLQFHEVYPGFLPALRAAAFNVISQATTSGLTTQDTSLWPVFAPYWMLFLSSILCSTGSAGGGIRMFRALLLVRQTGRELKLLIHPAAMAPVRIGGRTIPESVGQAVLAFIFLYLATALLLTFGMLLTGMDFPAAFAAVVASINNTAHGFGPPGAVHNFHDLAAAQVWICTAAMLLGRLEVFSVVVLLRPEFWRK